MLRTSLLWLLAGVGIGAAMLVDRALPGQWRAWLAPSHAHMLFVGWFLQFALGVAYWLLPRRRSPERPLGYGVRAAFAAAIALNLGLLLRVAAEPLERAGLLNDATLAVLGASALLQLGAAMVFVAQFWPRLGARPVRGRAADGRVQPNAEPTS